MRTVITRDDVTGNSTFRFFTKHSMLFKANIPCLPSSPVFIDCGKIRFRSSVDGIDSELARSVVEENHRITVCSFKLDPQKAEYQMKILDLQDSVHITYDSSRGIVFSVKSKEIGVLFRLSGNDAYLRENDPSSGIPVFLAECDDDLSSLTKIAVLSFPLLRFDTQEIANALWFRNGLTDPLETSIILRSYVGCFNLDEWLK